MSLSDKIFYNKTARGDAGNSFWKRSKQIFCISILTITAFPALCSAQWTGSTKQNTLVVSGCKNPINISTAADNAGGTFIFWEDKTDQKNSDIFFQYLDEEGQIGFRADGKPVSGQKSVKTNPVCAQFTDNSALVVWRDYSGDKAGDLVAQKVSSDGNLLFGETGMKITNRNGEELDHSMVTDAKGNVFITYIYRDYAVPSNYSVCVQKLSNLGYPGFRENGIQIVKSPKVKSHPLVTPDNLGGAYIFWVESSDGTAQLYSSHIDQLGIETWQKAPVLISRPRENVFNYITIPAFNSSAYIAWEVKKYDKNIVHSLVSLDGKNLWRRNRDDVSSLFGSQTNPQAFYADSAVTISWVNETLKDKDIYIQRFDFLGKPQWKKDGEPVIRMRENQISQRTMSDRSGGAMVSWLDNRNKPERSNIFIQHISRSGKPLWDSTGIEMAAGANTDKSYLSLVPNKSNAAAIVFKETRGGINSIYAQRIMANGKFIFEILNFTARIQSDIVKLHWQTTNESNNKGFFVERATQDSGWHKVKFIAGRNKPGISDYEFSDRPPVNGTVQYRIQQMDQQNNYQRTAPVKVNYFGADYDNFAVSQNFPNPFSDSTFIRYYLPERCSVVLEVYNDKIEPITELVHGVQEQGEYTVKFSSYYNGAKLPAGVYFYKLKAGEFVDVKKMIIAK